MIIAAEQRQDLIQTLNSFKNKKVLIIGDVGLDEYVMGDVRRISPEAPVPIVEVSEEDKRLGLAANVAQNVASLGGIPLMVGVVGHDAGALTLQEICHKAKVSWDHMIYSDRRPTTRKMRIMTGAHHIVRVDYEMRKYLSAETEDKVLQRIKELIQEADVVILQDYNKGVISQSLVKRTVEICQQHHKKLLVDPTRSNPGEFYRGVDMIKPNYEEAVAISGLKFDELRENPNKILEVGRALQKKTGAKEVVLTRGKEGMTIFSGDKIDEVPTFARKVFDVTGAGDTVIAALSLGVAAQLPLVKSCTIANFAAGVVVGKIGCVPCETSEIQEYIRTAQS
ncbi:MAG TPA: D-glycero-beta-D-manno-heptose-7-phosphate kinase [Pseudobdellovibrionaceae bacterium]